MHYKGARGLGGIALAAVIVILTSSSVLMLSSVTPTARAESIGQWNATTSYPSTVEGSSCAISGAYLYCVGGFVSGSPNDSVFYASVSASGIGSWTQTTNYPIGVYLASCVVSGGYLTCVGGLVSPGQETSAIYSAPVSHGGVGDWIPETSYPTNLEASSCAASGGYITCIGGLTDIGVSTNMVYSASLSSGTVGTWKATTSYPITVEGESCVGTAGYLTCVGGQFNAQHSNYLTSAVYYDNVSSGVLGSKWKATTNATSALTFVPCAVSGGYIYCIGGHLASGEAVNYAAISAGKLGSSWTPATPYPVAVVTMQCATSGGYVYCVGGETSAAYYSEISSSEAGTTSLSTTTSTPSTKSSSSTTASSFTVSSTPSSSGGNSAIPELPFQLGFILLAALVIVASFIYSRKASDTVREPAVRLMRASSSERF